MRAYTFSIHVDRPPQTVWAFLTDLSQTAKWRTMFRSMEVVGGGPLRAGAELRIVTEAYGKVTERTSSTLVFDPPRRWVMGSERDGVSGEFDYTVLPDGTGAKLVASCDLKAHRWLAWLFLPIIARQQKKLRTTQMDAFKRACEAATQRPR